MKIMVPFLTRSRLVLMLVMATWSRERNVATADQILRDSPSTYLNKGNNGYLMRTLKYTYTNFEDNKMTQNQVFSKQQQVTVSTNQVVPPSFSKVLPTGKYKGLPRKSLPRPKYGYRLPSTYISMKRMKSPLSRATFHQKVTNTNVSIGWDYKDFGVNFHPHRPGPPFKLRRAPRATLGEPWPLPQHYKSLKQKVYRIDRNNFWIKIKNNSCDVIRFAVERFKETAFSLALEEMTDNLQNLKDSGIKPSGPKNGNSVHYRARLLSSLAILIKMPTSHYPTDNSDESYDLLVNEHGALIRANEVWGAIHGLETFSQLIYRRNNKLYVRDTSIQDFPRFRHRGILIDTSRHYIKKSVLMEVIDGMTMNKMNVLHWHIVDDQSFSYESKVFPQLSKKGAFHPSLVYTQEDITDIIEYARLRGVRVMSEFDTPGHTFSWGLGLPDLLTQCYDKEGKPIFGYLGPMNPSRNSTYEVLRSLFREVLGVFRDKYLHLGGDEVPLECWLSNPEVKDFMLNLSNLTKEDDVNNGIENKESMIKVWKYFTHRLMAEIREVSKHRTPGTRFMMWEETFKNDLEVPKDTVIHIWMGGQREVQRAVDKGYDVIYSSCWYLDHIEKGIHWPNFYICDPNMRAQGMNNYKESKILGGEACLWSEYITSENVINMLWPRASAVAERLWSNSSVTDIEDAATRIEEHSCRMLRRGLNVGQMNGPNYCLPAPTKPDREIYESDTDIFVQRIERRERKPILWVTCGNDLEVASLMFSMIGILMVLVFFGMKLKSMFFRML